MRFFTRACFPQYDRDLRRMPGQAAPLSAHGLQRGGDLGLDQPG